MNTATTEAPEAIAPEVSPGSNDSAPAAAPQAAPLPPVEPTSGLDNDTISLSDITGAHIETMPDFDPAIHAVDKDGNPRRRGDGSYALKRGRKAGNGAGQPRPATGQNAPAPEAVQEAREADEAAKTAANLTIWGGVAIFGEDFRPSKGEPEMLHHAYRDYFAAKGVTKLPPELGLVVALSAYVLPRLAQPTVRTRAATIGLKIRDFFGKFKRKSKGDAIGEPK